MTKPTPRLSDPFRPPERPHIGRTVTILAILLAAMVATAVLTVRVIDTPAGRIVKQDAPVQTYDPGLYTPFTRPPVAP